MLRANIKRFAECLGYRITKITPVDNGFSTQKFLLDQKKDPVIFDLGANVGQTTAEYRKTFPSATIYAFEPFPQSYNQVVSRFAQDPLVKPFNFATSDTNGERSFNITKGSTMNSLLAVVPGIGNIHMGGELADTIGSIKVNTTTLDDFCSKNHVERIDILKMDIQGSELPTLRGAQKLLKRKAIALIYTEVLFAELYKGVAQFDTLWAYLKNSGFILHSLHDLCAGTNGCLGYADALFCQTS